MVFLAIQTTACIRCKSQISPTQPPPRPTERKPRCSDPPDALFAPGAVFAADAPKQIAIDWATYNPVSIILKEKGLLEKEFEKDGIKIVWVQSAGSHKALAPPNSWAHPRGSALCSPTVSNSVGRRRS
jgi:hypothetical protein